MSTIRVNIPFIIKCSEKTIWLSLVEVRLILDLTGHFNTARVPAMRFLRSKFDIPLVDAKDIVEWFETHHTCASDYLQSQRDNEP